MRNFLKNKLIKVTTFALILIFSSQQIGWAEVIDLRDSAGFEDYALAIAAGYMSAQAINPSWSVAQTFAYTYLIPEASKSIVKGLGLKGTSALVANTFLSTYLVSQLDYANSSMQEQGAKSANIIKRVTQEARSFFGKFFAGGAAQQGALINAITAAGMTLVKETVRKAFKNAKILAEALGYFVGKYVGQAIRVALEKQFGVFLHYDPKKGPSAEKPEDKVPEDKIRSYYYNEQGELVSQEVSADVAAKIQEATAEGKWVLLVNGQVVVIKPGERFATANGKEWITIKQVRDDGIIVWEATDNSGSYTDAGTTRVEDFTGSRIGAVVLDADKVVRIGNNLLEVWVEEEGRHKPMTFQEAMKYQMQQFREQSRADDYRVLAQTLLGLAGLKGEALILLSSGAGSWMAGGSLKEGLYRGAISAGLQWLSQKTKSPLHGAVFAAGASAALQYALIRKDRLGKEGEVGEDIGLFEGKKDYELFRAIISSAMTNANADFMSFGRARPELVARNRRVEFDFRWTSGDDVFFLSRYSDYVREVQKYGLGGAMLSQLISAYHYQAVQNLYSIISGQINRDFYVKRLIAYYDKRLQEAASNILGDWRRFLEKKEELVRDLLARQNMESIEQLERAINELAQKEELSEEDRKTLNDYRNIQSAVVWLSGLKEIDFSRLPAMQSKKEFPIASLLHILVAFDPLLAGLGASTLGKDPIEREMKRLEGKLESLPSVLGEDEIFKKLVTSLEVGLQNYLDQRDNLILTKATHGWQLFSAINGTPYVYYAPRFTNPVTKEPRIPGVSFNKEISAELEKQRIKATPEYQVYLREERQKARESIKADLNTEENRQKIWHEIKTRYTNSGDFSKEQIGGLLNEEIERRISAPDSEEQINLKAANEAYKKAESEIGSQRELVGVAVYRDLIGRSPIYFDRWQTVERPTPPPTPPTQPPESPQPSPEPVLVIPEPKTPPVPVQTTPPPISLPEPGLVPPQPEPIIVAPAVEPPMQPTITYTWKYTPEGPYYGYDNNTGKEYVRLQDSNTGDGVWVESRQASPDLHNERVSWVYGGINQPARTPEEAKVVLTQARVEDQERFNLLGQTDKVISQSEALHRGISLPALPEAPEEVRDRLFLAINKLAQAIDFSDPKGTTSLIKDYRYAPVFVELIGEYLTLHPNPEVAYAQIRANADKYGIQLGPKYQGRTPVSSGKE